MSLKAKEKIETNRYELEVEVGAQEFNQAIERAYRKNVKKMNVPGFRKGKAPRAVIEKLYGESVFYEEAVNDVYPAALDNALREASLVMVGDDIDFNIVSIGKQGLVFKACVTTKPEVEIGQYKGLEVVKKSVEVTDSEIDDEIERLRERNSRMVSVEGRALEKGDTAVFDFEGSIDGKPFEGGKAEGFSLEIGSGRFIPGFEDQMIGHNVDDEFEINVTFPEDYGVEELKGKPAVFKIKLHDIKTKELPELDDEFVKDVSEFDTLEELKADISKNIAERKELEAKQDIDDQLIDKLVQGLKAEIPNVMYEKRINDNVRDFEMRIRHQGLDMSTYLQYMGMDLETFRNSFRERAEQQVKLRLALEKIVEIEKIEPTDDDIKSELEKMADYYKMDVEKIKSIIPKEDLKMDIAVEKAVELLRNNAVIKEEKLGTIKKQTKANDKQEETQAEAKAEAQKEEADKHEKPAAKKTESKKTTVKKSAKN